MKRTGLQLVMLASFLVVLAAIISGAFVSAANAGAACSAWPLCTDGQLLPSSSAGWSAFAHRVVVLISMGLVATAALIALRQPRLERWVRVPLLLGPLFLLADVAVGALIVQLQLFNLANTGHLAVALLVLATQTVALIASFVPAQLAQQRLGGRAERHAQRYAQLAWWAAGAAGIVVLSRNVAPAALELSSAAPFADPSLGANAIALALSATLGWQTLRRRSQDRLLLGLSLAAVGLLLSQIALLQLAPTLSAWATLSGTLLWVTTISLAVLALRRPAPLLAPAAAKSAPVEQAEKTPSLLSDYISLTKPKVISLLLVTTLGAMYITDQGNPSLALVFWTMLGGYLAAGGAGAINCAFDGDIDINMGRTSRRPVPSGRISQRAAMTFGIALSVLSTVIMLVFTTPLAAFFSTLGIIYYAVFYTQWLKRSTWQNIVIGGGAGAIPPLVGWTAVTGSINVAAIMLFVIVYYWTPPHFWALALVKEKDYARAGVPMLPVVAGKDETRRQIWIYSVMLVALSALLTPLGAMGWIYLVSALGLGAIFLRYAWDTWQRGDQQSIWGLYKYSLLYLALIFAAMVIDRIIL